MKVLIVEDDVKVLQLLVKGFAEEKYSVETVSDGNEALKLALTRNYDLIITDVMIPGIDGFSFVEELRNCGREVPVIFLSAKKSTEDRIEGLKRGGDDYVVKPFSMSELLLRSKNLIRRTSKQSENQKLKYLDLELDLHSRTVKRGDTAIELHAKEFALIEFLLRNKGKVLTKTQILGEVWKYDFDPQTNVVDVLVCRVRNKIDRAFKIKLIKTYRGVGYAIKAD